MGKVKDIPLWKLFLYGIIVLAFIIMINFVLADMRGVEFTIPITTTINYSTVNVNDSLYWQGHTGTDGSWLTNTPMNYTNIAMKNETNSFIGLQEFNSTGSRQGIRITNGTSARSKVDIFVDTDKAYSLNTALYVIPTSSGTDNPRFYWGNATHKFASMDFTGVSAFANLPSREIQLTTADTYYCKGESCSVLGNEANNIVLTTGANGWLMNAYGYSGGNGAYPFKAKGYINDTTTSGTDRQDFIWDTKTGKAGLINVNHTAWRVAGADIMALDSKGNLYLTSDLIGNNLSLNGNLTVSGNTSLTTLAVRHPASMPVTFDADSGGVGKEFIVSVGDGGEVFAVDSDGVGILIGGGFDGLSNGITLTNYEGLKMGADISQLNVAGYNRNSFSQDTAAHTCTYGGSSSGNVEWFCNSPDNVSFVLGNLKLNMWNNDVLNISNLQVNGNVSMKRPYGMFSSTQDQTIALVNTAYPVTFNWTEDSYLITKEGNSNFSVAQQGDYLIELSAVFQTGVANKKSHLWVQKYNGTGWNNVPRSNTEQTIRTANSDYVIAVPFILDLYTTEKFRIMFASDDTSTFLNYLTNTSFAPETPSIIMTISKISEITT